MEASNTYEFYLNEAKQLLKDINKLIDKNAEKQKLDKENWGYVGSMTLIKELLETTKNFLK